ncbi:MAG: response regulator [Acidobacteriia bacterium]|nr:response regulator [Terriglobia bacterium]
MLATMLDDLGFDVEEACDGAEAIAVLRKGITFDVLLVDWNMPNVDGVELVHAVRNDPFYNKQVRLVMVTSVDEPNLMEKALTTGANEYLMKPFTKEMLADKLTLIGIARNN